MTSFPATLALTVALAALTTLVGRGLVALLGSRLLRRPTLENVLASAFLGTCSLVLAYGWCSLAGLGAPAARNVLALALAGLVVALLVRGRFQQALAFPRRSWFLLGVLLCLTARLGLGLLPLHLFDGIALDNDTSVYLSMAEWLQDHGTGVRAHHDPLQPIACLVHVLQGIHHRMGPVYLLALVRSCLPGARALDVYPAVMAWGTVLNIAGVLLLCRWVFRLSRPVAFTAAFVAAVAANSVCFAQHYGFLCQVHGTAALAFALALLARLLSRVNWRPAHALFFAVAACGLVSLYGELAPILGVACLVYLAQALLRARRAGQSAALASFAALTVLAVAVLGNVEHLRAARAVWFMVGVQGVGWHLPWSPGQFWAFTVGADFLSYTGRLFGLRQVALVAGTVTLLLGAARLPATRRALPLTAAVLTLTGLAVFYAGCARDPWTGHTGHTWNLFKLAQWSFPLVAALEGAGLAWLLRRLPARPVLAGGLCVACLAASYPAHHEVAGRTTAFARRALGSKHLLSEARRLRRRVEAHRPGNLCLLSIPEEFHPRSLVPYLLYPRPFVNGWFGSSFEMAGKVDRYDLLRPDTLFLLRGEPPFDPPRERLPLGYCIVDATRPLIFRAAEQGDSVRLEVFAPRPGPATLSFRLATEPASVQVREPGGVVRVCAVQGGTVMVPVLLPGGTSRLVVCCPGAAALHLGACRIETR
jgi:hypothetical protein